MGDKTYSGKEALIALVNGMKLRISHWEEGCYIYMCENGDIYTNLEDKRSLSTFVDYIEYKEPIEPKNKHTYHRAYYKKKLAYYNCVYCTAWHITEKDMLETLADDSEVVEIETREF